MGVSLTGAACLYGGIDGNNAEPALYIVGGSTNSSSIQYTGLQRYSIQDKTWTTITPLVTVTMNRQHHGAAYMLDTSTILIYGGSQQGDTDPSTQTFLMDTFPPYSVQSYQSTAPPVVDPIMLPWDDGHVGMVGGSTTNVNVYRFGVEEGWEDVGVNLPNPLPSYEVAQCALLTLDDKSKVLETFDLSQSPNVIYRNVLLDAGGTPASYNETVGGITSTSSASGSSSSSTNSRFRKRKRDVRDVVLTEFPAYNATDAPSTTRSGYSLAQSSDGLVVIAGGSATVPLEIFNQTANGWVDAAKLLNPQGKAQSLIAGSTSSTTAPTSTSTPTSTPAAAPAHSSKSHTLTILGAVLGAVCGLAAVLILLLLLLRYKKRSRHLKEQQQRRSYSSDKKMGHGQSSTEDQGLQPLSRAAQPMGRSPVPSEMPSGVDSMAMFGGKSDVKKAHTRNTSSISNMLKLDPISTSHISFAPSMFLRTREKSPLQISRPIMQEPAPEVQPRPSMDVAQPSSGTIDPAITYQAGSHRKTDEGWSTYFQGNNVVNLAENRPFSSQSRPGSSGSRSSKRGSYWPDPNPPTAPFMATPSNLRDSSGNMLAASSVSTGSPRLEHPSSYLTDSGLIVPHAQKGRISSASSATDDNDEYEAVEYEKGGDAYSSGIPASVHELPAWSPVGNTWSGPVSRQIRSHSSSISETPTNFNNPPYAASTTKEMIIPSFPMPNSSIRHVNKGSISTLPVIDPHVPAHFATTTRQLPPPSRPARPEETHVERRDYFGPSAPRIQENANTDVSWLNLGGETPPKEPRR